jgi:hypothetical protein
VVAPPYPPPAPRKSGCAKACGCLLLLTFAFLCCGGGSALALGWWALTQLKLPGSDGSVMDGVKQVENIVGDGEVGKLHREARREAPAFDAHNPPPLIAERLDAYLAVRKDLRPEFDKNRAVLHHFAESLQSSQWTMDDVLALTRTWGELKRHHAEALVRRRMSSDEYQYISALIFTKLGPTPNLPPEALGQGGASEDPEAALLRSKGGAIDATGSWLVEEMLLTTDFGRFNTLSEAAAKANPPANENGSDGR